MTQNARRIDDSHSADVKHERQRPCRELALRDVRQHATRVEIKGMSTSGRYDGNSRFKQLLSQIFDLANSILEIVLI